MEVIVAGVVFVPAVQAAPPSKTQKAGIDAKQPAYLNVRIEIFSYIEKESGKLITQVAISRELFGMRKRELSLGF